MPVISISVIIPVINEAEQLLTLIPYLQKMPYRESLHEIIVTDGGSTDNSIKIAEIFGVTIVKSLKGRAVQMNTAAKTANGNVLYFLHADTLPPAGAWGAISNAIGNGTDAGCFRLQFETKSLFLKLNAWVTRFNINAIRFGDQSLFVKKEVFQSVGGFDEKHIVLEDQNIITRISKNFRFKVLPFAVRTSDRKYRENGYVKLQSIFFIIYLLYKLGVPQQKLVSLYRKWIRKGKV
ncbi:MAG: hypothetical protein JWQ40_390 [Segetibacter sp.]|nr:hypothetical protein [Segetibacter sp.]